ncbi:MAG: hypothetical protein WCL00_16355, partial [Bacteroidota bacterium]
MKLTIKSLLFSLFSVFILMLIIGLYLSLSSMNKIETQSKLLLEKEMKSKEILKIKNDFLKISGLANEMILYPNIEEKRDKKESVYNSIGQMNVNISELKKREIEEGEKILEQLQQELDEFQKQVNKDYQLLVNKQTMLERGGSSLLTDEQTGELSDQVKKVENGIDQYQGFIKKSYENSIAESNKVFNDLRALILTFLGILFLFGWVVLISVFWFTYSIVGGEPSTIKDMTRTMTEGDLSANFPDDTKGIFHSVKLLQKTLLEVAFNAENIAKGDFSVEIT